MYVYTFGTFIAVLEPENVFTLHEDIAKEVFKRKQIILHIEGIG